MESILVKIRQLDHGKGLPLPTAATEGSAGLDLRAAIRRPMTFSIRESKWVPTGIVIALPEGYEGQVRSRGGLALNHGIVVLNSPGTVDSDYRGEVGVILMNFGEIPFSIHRGDRIAQLVIKKYTLVNFLPVEELDDTERGEGALGHTGVE